MLRHNRIKNWVKLEEEKIARKRQWALVYQRAYHEEVSSMWCEQNLISIRNIRAVQKQDILKSFSFAKKNSDRHVEQALNLFKFSAVISYLYLFKAIIKNKFLYTPTDQDDVWVFARKRIFFRTKYLT